MQILVNSDPCWSGTGKSYAWSKGFKRTWQHWPSFKQIRQGKLGTFEAKAEPTDYPSCAGC